MFKKLPFDVERIDYYPDQATFLLSNTFLIIFLANIETIILINTRNSVQQPV